MALTQKRMRQYFKDREAAVSFVKEHLNSLDGLYVSTMTIRHTKSGDFSVHIATEDWSGVLENLMPDSFHGLDVT